MATNPSWGITATDVQNFNTKVIPQLQNIANAMRMDPRYAWEAVQVDQTIALLQQLTPILSDYLQVQGT